MILGIDEAGRGALAGPLVVAAVASARRLNYARDSKQISRKMREQLFPKIIQDSDYVGIGWVSNQFIDEYGLSRALEKASRQAISGISHQNYRIIIDGKVNLLGLSGVECLAKADSLIKQVSAASIVAKVVRDLWMRQQARHYPDWGFDKHFGYGTKQHLERLLKYEATPQHRYSFAPLKHSVR